MSIANIVLTAMRGEHVYRPDEIAAATNLDRKTVTEALRHLVRGMIVESMPDEKYKRRKAYKSKQIDLGIGHG